MGAPQHQQLGIQGLKSGEEDPREPPMREGQSRAKGILLGRTPVDGVSRFARHAAGLPL